MLQDKGLQALQVRQHTGLTICLVPPMQKWDSAEALLYVCRRLWGQPYVAPVYALLLHQWLLLNKDAGGQLQRQKHVNVLISGVHLSAV